MQTPDSQNGYRTQAQNLAGASATRMCTTFGQNILRLFGTRFGTRCAPAAALALALAQASVPATAMTAGKAPLADKGAYAELAVRRGAVADDAGKLRGGELVPVASMTLPATHTVGDALFKYEGPGWESELVAYRLYFDHRAAIDVFGKTRSQLVLPQVGVDGSDYHTLADWGMDVLKVGNSLGLGGIGAWSDSGLTGVNTFDGASLQIHNEPDASGVDLQYSGWQTPEGARDLTMQLRIAPGSRLTHVRATVDQPLPGWATGIVRHGLQPLTYRPADSEWGYLATWGMQSLADDQLGMAIFFRNADLAEIRDDANNHLVQLKGAAQVEYYFAGVWRAEGIDSEQDFISYLQQQVSRLNQSPSEHAE
uniref:DUF4861 family protein n=1 Tax=Microbulbifer agarilyticus TaxID=260552 RepID=UPI0002559D32|nr:DUF4861 family protein [Microbulbifer agarilyticus]